MDERIRLSMKEGISMEEEISMEERLSMKEAISMRENQPLIWMNFWSGRERQK